MQKRLSIALLDVCYCLDTINFDNTNEWKQISDDRVDNFDDYGNLKETDINSIVEAFRKKMLTEGRDHLQAW